jgi:polyene macrolide polyketide synthase
MQAERPDIQYETHSFNEVLYHHPEQLQRMFRSLAEQISAGHVCPLPKKVYTLRGELKAAFAWLQSGNAIGKVVVSVEPPIAKSSWVSEGAIVVTGGLGGLGLVTAEALVEAGARCVVLVSRSGRVKYSDQGLEARMQGLMSSGCQVVLETCDVSNEQQVAALLARVRVSHGPIRGVVHAAGVLADAMLPKQSPGLLQQVWGPKANAAWYLHKHTAEDTQLEMFVLFSSVASLFGNAGQANYAAANAFLDNLARMRAGQGLPAVSVQWPAVAGVGMAAALDVSLQFDTRQSIPVATVKQTLKQIVSGMVLCHNPVQAVVPCSLIEHLRKLRISNAFISMLGLSTNVVEARQAVEKKTRTADDILAVVIRISTSLIKEGQPLNIDMPLMELGLDSLGATELVGRLSKEFGVPLSSTLVFSFPTVTAIAEHITDLLYEPDVPRRLSRYSIAIKARRPTAYSDAMYVTGMACRFPGNINSLEALARLLADKATTTAEAPLSRWDTDAIIASRTGYDSSALNRIRYGSFLPDEVLESFDNRLFGVSDAEAAHMDPSQRLLLTVAHEAFLDAGCTMASLKGWNIGVFVASSSINGAP